MNKKLANNEQIGIGTTIHETAEFINVESLIIGDHCYIGPGVRIVGGDFKIGDYSKIHNNCYIYPKKHITLGHCTWVGQGTHLDGTGGINSGDFLGVGINSALYSHIRHGDITEGCRYDKNSYLKIGDDVWFVGMCLVSPIEAEDKSLALLGSVVTKDMKFNRVYGGNPATDITNKVGAPWIDRSISEKIFMIQSFIDQYWREHQNNFEKDSFIVCENLPDNIDDRTYYCVESRCYTKRNTKQEIQLNKWMFSHKAKFKPIDNTGHLNESKCNNLYI